VSTPYQNLLIQVDTHAPIPVRLRGLLASVKTNICRQLRSVHSPPDHIFRLCADVELWSDPRVVQLFSESRSRLHSTDQDS
jgi:hypothetical protein